MLIFVTLKYFFIESVYFIKLTAELSNTANENIYDHSLSFII